MAFVFSSRLLSIKEAASSPQLATRFTAEIMKFVQKHHSVIEKHVVTLAPGTRLERVLNPTHIQYFDDLRKNHPGGSGLVTNRWSGSLLGLFGWSGSYFGFAPVQEQKHATALSSLNLRLFGVNAEMEHYVKVQGLDGNPSKIEAGVKKHGEIRLPNGEVNPYIGMSGSCVVRYLINDPIRLLHVDLESQAFIDMLNIIGANPKVKEMLPENVSLEALLMHEETRAIHLLYRALAAALYQKSEMLKITGIVSPSFRSGSGKRA